MEKSNFDLLLKRYLTGQVSEAERIKVEAWLEVMKTDDPDAIELSSEDEEKIFQNITASRSSLEEIKVSTHGKRKLSPAGWTFRVAASLVMITIASYVGWQIGKSHNKTLAESTDGHVEKVLLKDGSLVWLKDDSKLVHYLDEENGIRYNELKGEALFEVARDAEHPFVIRCGAVTLRVLGTSFNVKARGDTLELSVLTGKVNISLGQGKMAIDAIPNDRILYTGQDGFKKIAMDTSAILMATARTEYQMEFNNAPLGQVIERLHKKFNAAIMLADKKAGACKITVDLTDRSLEQSLQMITEVLDVTYHQEGDKITVTGSGCSEVEP
ncbi:MAG TPA: FecR domain-containing protein [Ohtaekwangia sp.]|nr:FecR domain-containing protein [Ohtaekwangia sp.]